MTKKMEEFINGIIEELPKEEQEVYKELTAFCLSLGLNPKKVNKKDTTAIDFMNTKKNYSILRFGLDSQGTIFGLRYYASEQYAEKFHQAIREIIDSYKGEYVGCYNCGNCQGHYIYHHPDGKEYVRCGFAMVPVQGITMEDVPEVKRLIENQNELYNR